MNLQNPAHPAQVLKALTELISDPLVERLRVAVAYANVGGVRALQTLLETGNVEVPVEVVVTLDMGITRKAALEVLLREFPGTTKTITTPGGSGTFHPKAFVVDRGAAPQHALVGSANLTDAALTRNHEAVSAADLTTEETAEWETWWADIVADASELTEDVIANYTERAPQPGVRERIADEDVETHEDGSIVVHGTPELDSRDAEWLVIDWGGPGEYRVQFEFPKLAAAFFRPDRNATRTVTISYDGQDYRDNQLTYYADNGMVRINLDAHIPAVEDGSIKLQTSLFTRRGPDDFELRLVSGADRARLLAEAALVGGTAHTRRRDNTAREFGWV